MNSWDSLLDKRIPTVFSVLRGHGYTQSFFSNYGILVKNFKENFGQIMDECAYFTNAHLVTAGALRWIKRQRSPFFIWIYYLEPHRPYIPPAPHNILYKYPAGIQLPIKEADKDFDGSQDYIPYVVAKRNIRDVNYYIAQYDGQIHYADEEVGKLLAELKKLNLFDRSLIVLTSDHGESLGEHHLYFSHTFTLFNEVIRIPLLIKMPGQRQGAIIKENAGSVDILPTILGGVGIKNYQDGEGIDLSDKSGQDRGLFAFISEGKYCFIYGNWKLIKYPFSCDNSTEYINPSFPGYGLQDHQLFNIERDPAELVDLKSTNASEFKEMLSKSSQGIKKKKPMVKATGSFAIGEQEKREMRSLGYVQ